ncbi:hypothetical protein [Prochlorococcus marinus]|uniref:hypothetical protein n=1 Tax=Prochlorococcus marinus TaxID=1219 RepID=UPI0022B4B964|nr:hypothetical protein [Prochlorococcus marinus]
MNNTEVTLDQLAEIAGGPHYTTWNGYVNFKKTNPQWDVICDVGTSVKGDVAIGDDLGEKGKYTDQGATCAIY